MQNINTEIAQYVELLQNARLTESSQSNPTQLDQLSLKWMWIDLISLN